MTKKGARKVQVGFQVLFSANYHLKIQVISAKFLCNIDVKRLESLVKNTGKKPETFR